MATASQSSTKLNNLKCTICHDSSNDVVVLSCGHTFCHKCLPKDGRGVTPGQKLACPYCGEFYTVPDGGMRSLFGKSGVNKYETEFNYPKCVICHSYCDDLKFLSCGDQLCSECLPKDRCDVTPGQKLPCPYCGELYIVPDGGINNRLDSNMNKYLTSNHSVETETPVESSKQCLCTVLAYIKPNMKATKFCQQCKEFLCSRCSMDHYIVPLNRLHRMVTMGELFTSDEQEEEQMPRCPQHPHKGMPFYCHDCMMTLVYLQR